MISSIPLPVAKTKISAPSLNRAPTGFGCRLEVAVEDVVASAPINRIIAACDDGSCPSRGGGVDIAYDSIVANATSDKIVPRGKKVDTAKTTSGSVMAISIDLVITVIAKDRVRATDDD